jgi:hypothetical protein
MADKDYSQLTSATTAGDSDLLAIYPTGGPLKKLTWATFKSLVITALGSTYLTVANNLADLASASAARANLGLGTAATLASSALFQVANNLSEVANAATARANLGAAASTSPTITGGMTFSGAVAGNTLAVAATTLDVSQAEYQTKSISANTTFTLSGQVAGKWSGMILELTLSSGAQPTFTGARWGGGSTPNFINGVHLIGLIYSGASWTAVVVESNIS